MTTTATATVIPASTARKTAYNKGWASIAQTAEAALTGYRKTNPNGELEWFLAGYNDKHNGSAKWTTIPGVAKPAEAPQSEEASAAEEPTEAPAPAPEKSAEAPAPAPRKGRHVSVSSLQKKITKKTTREEAKKIRAEVAAKKNHYKMGWNSFLSPLFGQDHAKAQAGYIRRHTVDGQTPYLGDWEDGWKDAKTDKKFGEAWS